MNSESEAQPTIEEHQKRDGTAAHVFAAAKAYYAWGVGKRLSPGEYETAIEAVTGLKFR